MVDMFSKQALKVQSHCDAGPYLYLPLDQLDDVRSLLDAHGFSYWTSENAISMDGSPYRATIYFARETDAHAAQQALDDNP